MFIFILISLLVSSLHCISPKERAQKLVAQMSLDDCLKLVSGVPGDYVGNTVSQEKFGIPELHLEDGPQGVADKVDKVTCFPNALALASTFDLDLMEDYTSVLAEEQRIKGSNIMLGPMMNVARVPFGGRNFESLGEDTYLTSKMAVANIVGIQKKGVMGCAKHYVNNNQEQDRGTVSAKVDDRTQHEIYYPPFKASVDAGVGSFMCSYNKINGTYACENKETIDTLKYWMGFDGFIMSDWGATHSTVDSANNGLDQEMPGSTYFGDALKKAVSEGKVPESRIEDMAVRILTAMYAVGIMDTPQTGNITSDAQSKEHVEKTKEYAKKSTVLLKNEGILPLSIKENMKIAIIGDEGDFKPIVVGGGSGHVKCPYINTPFNGIQDYLQNSTIQVKYTKTNPISDAKELAKWADVAIVFVGTTSSEGVDRPTLALDVLQDTLVEGVASVNENLIVVVNGPGAVLMPWVKKPKAILFTWLPGQEYGSALSEILFGDFNPYAKLPLTFPLNDKQTPLKTDIQYPGVNLKTEYTEGLFVGYKWYDQNNENPLFPFGHGLSYTTFEYGDIVISGSPLKEGQKVSISLKVSNTGKMDGTEIVQLYIGYPDEANEPPKLLRGFKAVEIKAGDDVIVEFKIEYGDDVSIWNTVKGDWEVIKGTYPVYVGSSSRDIRKTGKFEIV